MSPSAVRVTWVLVGLFLLGAGLFALSFVRIEFFETQIIDTRSSRLRILLSDGASLEAIVTEVKADPSLLTVHIGGLTACHDAVILDRPEVLRALLDHGASISPRVDGFGMQYSPLELAVASDYCSECIDVLLEHPRASELTDEDLELAIAAAEAGNRPEVAARLEAYLSQR